MNIFNKFMSSLYKFNWKYERMEEGQKLIWFSICVPLLIITVIGLPIGVSIITGKDLVNWIIPFMLVLAGIGYLIRNPYTEGNIEKYMTDDVKLGKEVDKKYKELQNVCHSEARNLKKIKELADFVFPNLLKLHGKKEVNKKVFHCFRSVVAEDNLDTVRYFIIEQNVKVSKEFRKNLKEQFPEIEKLFNISDLKNELDTDLKQNRSETKSKPMKL